MVTRGGGEVQCELCIGFSYAGLASPLHCWAPVLGQASCWAMLGTQILLYWALTSTGIQAGSGGRCRNKPLSQHGHS